MNRLRAESSWSHLMIRIVIVAGVYFGAALLGLTLQLPGTNASPVWPPSGIAFAAVLFWGFRVWPGIMLGAFLANLLTLPQSLVGFQASTGIMIGNTLEAVLGFYILQRLNVVDTILESAQSVFRLIAVALLMCLISSTFGPLNLCIHGIIPWAAYVSVSITWWVGDVTGVLVFTPLLLTWRKLPTYNRWKLAEALGVLTVVVLVGQFIFSGQLTGIPLAYSLIPPLLWAALRLGPHEVFLSVAVASFFAIAATVNGSGAFVRKSLNESLTLLQLFIAILSVTMLFLTAALAERRRAQQASHLLAETLEQQVQERTQELSRKNRDLETLLYISSHDLREPLRAIGNYAQLLQRDYEEKLEERGNGFLNRIIQAAFRLNRLLDELLQLKRAQHLEYPTETSDSRVLVNNAVERLVQQIEETNATVEIHGDFPQLHVHETWGTQAVYNLLTNALKFTCPGESPDIEIFPYHKTIAEGEELGIVVADRGPGIEPEYRENIFMLFKRAVGRDVEGTGAGLAIVKQIAERHNGRVWVEDRSGGGVQFVLVLETLARG